MANKNKGLKNCEREESSKLRPSLLLLPSPSSSGDSIWADCALAGASKYYFESLLASDPRESVQFSESVSGYCCAHFMSITLAETSPPFPHPAALFAILIFSPSSSHFPPPLRQHPDPISYASKPEFTRFNEQFFVNETAAAAVVAVVGGSVCQQGYYTTNTTAATHKKRASAQLVPRTTGQLQQNK